MGTPFWTASQIESRAVPSVAVATLNKMKATTSVVNSKEDYATVQLT